jgi:phosphohistidine phosphatase
MRRLLLLRHAKAVQDAGEGDHARTLSNRGREDAARMGHAMDNRGYLPELTLCSTSRRTTETWERIAPELAKAGRVEFTKELYLAPPKQILAVVRAAPDGVSSLMLIGHNPGMEEAASRLARKPASKAEDEKLEDLEEKFPTCALAILDFEAASWADIGFGEGILLEFLKPRDLKA